MIAVILALRFLFYNDAVAVRKETFPSAAPVFSAPPDPSLPKTPTRHAREELTSSPRPLLPIQVRLAAQANHAHSLPPMAGPPSRSVAPVPRRPVERQPKAPPAPSVPTTSTQQPPSSEPSVSLDEDDDEYGIPELDALYQKPPNRTAAKAHEVNLDSAVGKHLVSSAAVRQSGIARHADDLGRVWLGRQANPVSQEYLMFSSAHRAFSPPQTTLEFLGGRRRTEPQVPLQAGDEAIL